MGNGDLSFTTVTFTDNIEAFLWYRKRLWVLTNFSLPYFTTVKFHNFNCDQKQLLKVGRDIEASVIFTLLATN